MEKKITVAVAALSGEDREKIRAIAQEHGYAVSFFENSDEAMEDVRTAEICYASSTQLARAGKELKWFHSSSAGIDAYLKPGVFSREDVILTNSSGAYGVTIAEHIVMAALTLLRRQLEYGESVARRQWRQGLKIRSVKDSTVTLLGTGDIGTEAAKRIRAFGPRKIWGVNRRGLCPSEVYDEVIPQEEIERVLPLTDILIMSLPGTAQTVHFMDARRLELLPAHAILINVGRGSALDQRALERALREGTLGGAALDVFETEPLGEQDTLWTCPNLLITPHIAGNLTLDWTAKRNAQIFCDNLEAYLGGRPFARLADKKAGY